MTPDPALRHPARLFAEIADGLRASPDLARQLFLRDLRANYRQSLLGYLWAFLPPLAWAATFVFLREQNVMRPGDVGPNYPAFVITGMVAWLVFVDAMSAPLRHFSQARPLLGKIRFPHEALLLAGLAEVTFQLLTRTPLLLWATLTMDGSSEASPTLFLLSLGWLATLGSAIGVLLLPLGLLFQDVTRGLTLVTSFWLLLTPVGYEVPPGGLIAALNPVSPLIHFARASWLGIPATSMGAAIAIGFVSLVVFVLAWVAVRVAMPHLVARMGA